MTPAEERAAREGLPVVRLLTVDALRVAAGHPMIVTLADGSEALVRLYTADEFLPLQHAAADEHGAERIDRARALSLTRPLDVTQ